MSVGPRYATCALPALALALSTLYLCHGCAERTCRGPGLLPTVPADTACGHCLRCADALSSTGA